jgi:hypothetical protein
MPPKEKKGTDAQRLAKGLQPNKESEGIRRQRKDSVREKLGGHAGRTLANERDVSPLTRLMGALQAEKIRFQLIGMSAAVVQGVPVATRDVDLWIDLPSREYMRPMNVAINEGGKMIRNTVAELQDDTLVNFVFEVTGLRSFASEYRNAKVLAFHGLKVRVLPLESIKRSKSAINRPKDLAHIQQIDECLRCIDANNAGKKAKKK